MRRSNLVSSLIGFLIMVTPGACRTTAFLQHWHSLRPSSPLLSVNGDADTNELSQNNQLMHVMLRVPKVNATVDFWKEQGANVHSYRKSPKAETAFVGFGKQQKGYFSLEITSASETFVLGNAIQYLGISMLLGIQNLVNVAAGESSSSGPKVDPNGIELRRVASAPGDSFARLCLLVDTSKDGIFSKTTEFYETLGMKLMAADETNVCLRYENDKCQTGGVATTLVFTKTSQPLDIGNCFDHLAISTVDIQSAATFLKDALEDDDAIFLEPTPMFGTQVMGLTDPNGYKIYLVEES